MRRLEFEGKGSPQFQKPKTWTPTGSNNFNRILWSRLSTLFSGDESKVDRPFLGDSTGKKFVRVNPEVIERERELARANLLPSEIHTRTYDPDKGAGESSRDLKHSNYVAYSERQKQRAEKFPMANLPEEWIAVFASSTTNEYVQFPFLDKNYDKPRPAVALYNKRYLHHLTKTLGFFRLCSDLSKV